MVAISTKRADAAVAKLMAEKLFKADPSKLAADKAKFEKLRSRHQR
jgi:hypothetical protein